MAVAPGNYGLDFMKESYGYDLDRSVKSILLKPISAAISIVSPIKLSLIHI